MHAWDYRPMAHREPEQATTAPDALCIFGALPSNAVLPGLPVDCRHQQQQQQRHNWWMQRWFVAVLEVQSWHNALAVFFSVYVRQACHDV